MGEWAPVVSASVSLVTLIVAAWIKSDNKQSNIENTQTIKQIHIEINSNLKTALEREYERGRREERDILTAAALVSDMTAAKVTSALQSTAVPGVTVPTPK